MARSPGSGASCPSPTNDRPRAHQEQLSLSCPVRGLIRCARSLQNGTVSLRLDSGSVQTLVSRSPNHRRLRLRCRPQETPCSLPGASRPHLPRQGRQSTLLGIPGTGKTFLARALALSRLPGRTLPRRHQRHAHGQQLSGAEITQLERALRRYCRANFLVINNFAVLAMTGADQPGLPGHHPPLRLPAARPALPPIACSMTGPK